LTQGPDNNVLGAGAYRVFRKMPERGHPPDEWSQLLVEARAEGQRLQQFAASITP
jgi:toxin YhaV